MSARYYIKPHHDRHGEPDGTWSVMEDNGLHAVCISPCDSEEEAREELREILAKNK